MYTLDMGYPMDIYPLYGILLPDSWPGTRHEYSIIGMSRDIHPISAASIKVVANARCVSASALHTSLNKFVCARSQVSRPSAYEFIKARLEEGPE